MLRRTNVLLYYEYDYYEACASDLIMYASRLPYMGCDLKVELDLEEFREVVMDYYDEE